MCIDENNPYFRMVRTTWGQKLREVFDAIEHPAWDGHDTAAPLLMPSSRNKPLKKIGNAREKLI